MIITSLFGLTIGRPTLSLIKSTSVVMVTHEQCIPLTGACTRGCVSVLLKVSPFYDECICMHQCRHTEMSQAVASTQMGVNFLQNTKCLRFFMTKSLSFSVCFKFYLT